MMSYLYQIELLTLFFNIDSSEKFKNEFRTLVDSFVPHPLYFNKDSIEDGKTWIESILKLDEMNRIVSMIDSLSNPYAFNVKINEDVKEYSLVSFEDITQTLIKRIMIENHVNIDTKSGAYNKDYFLHVRKSYEDAAIFNEKIIGIIIVDLKGCDNLLECVQNFKDTIRQDDMFVNWNDGKFLLVHLVDSPQRTQEILHKLESMVETEMPSGVTCQFNALVQNKQEPISEMIKLI